MIIRRATTDDMPDVIELSEMFCLELGHNPGETLDNVKNRITIVFVAELNKEIVGIIGGIKIGATMYGDIFYVKKHKRGSRAAYKLIKAITSFAKSINCDKATVVVSPKRKSLYETAGYNQTMCIMEQSL